MMILRRLCLIVLIAFAASGATGAESYLSSERGRTIGFGELIKAVGEGRPISRITFQPDSIELVGRGDSSELARWSVSPVNLLILTYHFVSGPQQWSDAGIVDDPAGAFFRLSDVRVETIDAKIGAAIAYAKLQRTPQIISVEVARSISILPEPSYGDIHWTVALRTDRESASVTLNSDGQVIGGDLSDTVRVEELDLLASDDWPMAEAQALLAQASQGARVHDITISRRSISLTADHPTDPAQQRDYSWDLSGVRSGFVDFPNLIKLGMGDIASFELAEIDFTKLPLIKAAAIEAFASPGAIIGEIEATKPTDRASGNLQVLWEVHLTQTDRETGSVFLDAAGKIVEVKLPESRIVAGPWLAPATLVQTLKRLETSFGPDATVSEISINDERGSIEMEDPLAPGELAQFIVDPKDIHRFGTASFLASLEPGRVFTLKELSPLTEAKFTEFAKRTLKRMNMKGAEVYRYTISRRALIMNPNDKRLLIEVRAGTNQGNEGGWATYTLDGEEVDVLLP